LIRQSNELDPLGVFQPVYYEYSALHRQTKKIKLPPCKKNTPIKPQWPDFEKALEEEKWNPSSEVYIRFKKIYKCHPTVVHMMQKMATWRKGDNPRGTRWGYGDIFLMLLRSLRGHTAADISEIFGGKESTVSKAVRIGTAVAEDFQFIFSKSVPSQAEASELKARFREEGVPNPEDLFVGDCTDIPLWSSNDEYYTYKRCCPATHAIRVRYKERILALTCQKYTFCPLVRSHWLYAQELQCCQFLYIVGLGT